MEPCGSLCWTSLKLTTFETRGVLRAGPPSKTLRKKVAGASFASRICGFVRRPEGNRGLFCVGGEGRRGGPSGRLHKICKQLILNKLNVQASDICLPAYLSWKGAEACPCPAQEGHEAHDSTYHLFTEQQLALRPTFEEEPFKLLMEGAAQSGPASSGDKGGGRAAGKGGAGRGASGRGGRF